VGSGGARRAAEASRDVCVRAASTTLRSSSTRRADTVPIGQNPTGTTMGLGRKQAIYDVCVKHGASWSRACAARGPKLTQTSSSARTTPTGRCKCQSTASPLPPLSRKTTSPPSRPLSCRASSRACARSCTSLPLT
jgi:hypothetical protein